MYDKPIGHNVSRRGTLEWDARGTHPRYLFSKRELPTLTKIDLQYRRRIRKEYPNQPPRQRRPYSNEIGNVLIDARLGRLTHPYHDQIQNALREARRGIKDAMRVGRRRLPNVVK